MIPIGNFSAQVVVGLPGPETLKKHVQIQNNTIDYIYIQSKHHSILQNGAQLEKYLNPFQSPSLLNQHL